MRHKIPIILLIAVMILSSCTRVPSVEKSKNENPNEAQSTDEKSTEDPPQEQVEADITKDDKMTDRDEKDSLHAETEVEHEPLSLVIPELGMRAYATPDTERMNFVKDMGLGWNLGNTMDAVDANWVSDHMELESAWSGIKTTKKMMEDIKEAGFDTIRIPVSWHNHVTGSEHRVDEEWLSRVEEIVDWALEADLYTIINIHHDIDVDYLYPNAENYQTSSVYVNSIWRQVGERFKDHDEKLIFEVMNEPRLKGTTVEWWPDPNSAEIKDSIMTLNKLSQEILDTIRSIGSVNAERYIMIPGYVASPDGVLNSDFILPQDSATEKLILSVHSYSPYDFALRPSNQSESTDSFDVNKASQTGDITSFMTNLYNRYIFNGIPVVIGEFGSIVRDGNTQARIDHAAFFTANASARGMACIWWDNHDFNSKDGERFGLYNRQTGEIEYPEILEAMLTNWVQ